MIAPLLIPGAWMWSAWQPDRGMTFNSYLFETADGNVAVDPLPLDEESLKWLAGRGGVKTIVLTNRDHRRDAQALRERFGSRVVAHAPEAPLFDIAIDGTFAGGESVFPGARAIALPHGKTAGEVALYLQKERAVVLGAAILGAPAGALSLLPDEKLADPDRLVLALRKIWALQPEALLLCDGQPIFSGADAALTALLDSRAGAELYRVNLAEIEYEPDRDHERYQCDDGEIGLLIGARKLGYRVARIAAGKAFCPLHSHDREEEFFYILEGTPAIRTSRGTLQCRAGDFIAFPVGERGTHQLINNGPESCLVLMVGLNEENEVCFYPDSEKLLIDAPGSHRIVRSVPLLEYFDGE